MCAFNIDDSRKCAQRFAFNPVEFKLLQLQTISWEGIGKVVDKSSVQNQAAGSEESLQVFVVDENQVGFDGTIQC